MSTSKTSQQMYMFFDAIPKLNAIYDIVTKRLNSSKRLSINLTKAKPVFADFFNDRNPYTKREELEDQIGMILERKSTEGEYYFIIAGPKGAGKSALVEKIFDDIPGVVNIGVTQADTKETIIQSLLETCGLSGGSLKITEIRSALSAARNRRNGSPVTIIFEIERGSDSPVTLNAIKYLAKDFASAANVILVLSEANATLEFGDDPRQEIIWVDEMTKEEAMKYAKSIDIKITDDELMDYFESVGTLPLQIRNLKYELDRGKRLKEIIEDEIELALGLLDDFSLKPILRELKKNPDGVESRAFRGQIYNGIPLDAFKEVAVKMKSAKSSIMYHFPSRQYRLVSTAHKSAMARYIPIDG